MIKLKPRTRNELEKMLTICLEIEEAEKQWTDCQNRMNELYVVDDEAAWNKYQEEIKIYEEKKSEIRKDYLYGKLTIEEKNEKFNELKNSRPKEPERYIPKCNYKMWDDLMEQSRGINKHLGQKRSEKEQQEIVIMETFIDEYGLSEKHAEIVDKTDKESKKLYHNPSFGGKQRDLKDVCKNMAEGVFHAGRFQTNEAGVALYFGDLSHTKSYYLGESASPEEKPEYIIEASVKPDAKIYKIGLGEYTHFPGEEYLPYFEKEDFDLLNTVQRKAIMHLRCIFDVAMGYDACVRVNKKSVNKNEVWAIYNRSILELEKNPIKEFDSVVSEIENL